MVECFTENLLIIFFAAEHLLEREKCATCFLRVSAAAPANKNGQVTEQVRRITSNNKKNRNAYNVEVALQDVAFQLHYTRYSCTVNDTAAIYAPYSCTMRVTAVLCSIQLHYTRYSCTIHVRCTIRATAAL